MKTIRKKSRVLACVIVSFILIQNPEGLFAQFAGWENIGCTNSVSCMVRHNNDLWIGTPASLIKMDVLTGKYTLYNRANSKLPYNGVTDILIDHDQNIWVACETFSFPGYSALVKISDDQWSVYDFTNSPLNSSSICDLEIDQNNFLWVAIDPNEDDNVLYKFDGDEEDWLAIDIDSAVNISTPLINSISVDNNNTKWFGMGMDGLISLNDSNDCWEVYNTENSGIPHNIVNEVEVDLENVLWFSVNQSSLMPGDVQGLVSYDGSDWVIYNDTVSGNATSSTVITSIYVDDMNNKWIGCDEKFMAPSSYTALNCYDNQKWTIYDSINSGLIQCPVISIYQENDNTYWFGQTATYSYGYEPGLVKWEVQNNTWQSYNTNVSGFTSNIRWGTVFSYAKINVTL